VLREEIDRVDRQLVSLLNERARLVVEVGKRKAADGGPIYAPYREQAVLTKVLGLNEGPLLNTTLETIYREIMSGSFALERMLRIGYLGPPGSFSHEASVRQFGSSVQYENLRSIAGVFEEVSRGHVDYGLVPVENPSIGSVAETLEGFMQFPGAVSVCAEVHLSVTQALVAAPNAKPADIRVISSKAEAIGQCRRWLATQYPHAQLVHAASTSAAVADIAAKYESDPEGAKGMAAIGSKLAAQLHDLQVLFPDVSDNSPNVTRFLILCNSKTAAAASAPSGADKTSLLFVCGDRPGALRDVLDSFARFDINLSHIEKRPCPPTVLARLNAVHAEHAASEAAADAAAGAGSTSAAGSAASGPPGALALARGVSITTTGVSTPSGVDGTPKGTPKGTPQLGAAQSAPGVMPRPPSIDGLASAVFGQPAAPAASATSGDPAAGNKTGAREGETAAPADAAAAARSRMVEVPPSILVPALTGGRGSAAANAFVYAFFVDADEHVQSARMMAAVAEARTHTVCFLVLGSFPKARRVL
jgi:chorismate mutase/prephenate dehydratase